MGRTGYFVKLWAMAMSCFVTGLPALAQSTTFSLQRKVVAAVARDLHFDSEDPTIQVQILAPATMSLPARVELHVVSVRAGFSPGSWLLRMDCAARHDCMPFHVVLRLASAELRNLAGVDRLNAAAQPQDWSTHIRQVHAPLARSGDRMLLVEERPGMRLQARVVCLESGALGDAIRVRNLATHRVLLATIAGKDEVRVE
jgi:flagellar basal body P-ring formation chaperone FlgA